MQTWKTLDRRRVHQTGDGRFLALEHHTVQLPDGRVIDDWPWVITPSFVNVAAETPDGRFLVFSQTKYAADGVTLAVPGGYLEPGEDPDAAVRRELLEETGYRAAEWHFLGRYVVDGNRGSGWAHLYYAAGAVPAQAIDADDLEEQEMLLLTRAELAAALARGEFQVLPWAANVALALAHLAG